MKRKLFKDTEKTPYTLLITNAKQRHYPYNNTHNTNQGTYWTSNSIKANTHNNNSKVFRNSKSAKSIKQDTNTNHSQHNTLRKSFDIKAIRTDNQKEFFAYLSNDYPLDRNSMLESKSDLLSQLIVTIKEKGFDKYQKELNEKIVIKGVLEQSIENLKLNIIDAKNELKAQQRGDDMNHRQIGSMIKRVKEMKPVSHIDYNRLQEELIKLQSQIENSTAYTKEVHFEIRKNSNDLMTMKESIRKLTKMIIDIDKQRENFNPAIQLMKKHIKTLRDKLQSQKMLINTLTHNMTNVIDKDI